MPINDQYKNGGASGAGDYAKAGGNLSALSADQIRNGKFGFWSDLAKKVLANILPHSQAFDLWSPAAVTVSQGIANDPVNDLPVAGRLTETTATAAHGLNSVNVSFTSGVIYTFSIYAKYETAQFIQILFGSAMAGSNAWGNFDIQNGVLGTMGTDATGAVVDAGNGWFKISLAATATATTTTAVAIFGANSGTMARAFGYAGLESNTRLIADAQVGTGATANAYVPTE